MVEKVGARELPLHHVARGAARNAVSLHVAETVVLSIDAVATSRRRGALAAVGTGHLHGVRAALALLWAEYVVFSLVAHLTPCDALVFLRGQESIFRQRLDLLTGVSGLTGGIATVLYFTVAERLHFEQIPPEVGAGDEGGAEDGSV